MNPSKQFNCIVALGANRLYWVATNVAAITQHQTCVPIRINNHCRPPRCVCMTRTMCRWGAVFMLWVLGEPRFEKVELCGSFGVTACTSDTFRHQGKTMLPVESTKSACTSLFSKHLTPNNNHMIENVITEETLLFCKIKADKQKVVLMEIIKLENEKGVTADHYLSNACWDCFRNFALVMPLKLSIQVMFRKRWHVSFRVGLVTHDSTAQPKDSDRKITAIFTLCLTEVANWLHNDSIPPPFKTKERQLLVVEAPFTLGLQTDC